MVKRSVWYRGLCGTEVCVVKDFSPQTGMLYIPMSLLNCFFLYAYVPRLCVCAYVVAQMFLLTTVEYDFTTIILTTVEYDFTTIILTTVEYHFTTIILTMLWLKCLFLYACMCLCCCSGTMAAMMSKFYFALV